MHEVIPPPGGKEHLFGPADKLLLVTGDRRIAQEQGWTRCRLVSNEDGNWILWLTGLGLKRAEHRLHDTNIYRMYPQLSTEPSASQFDNTVVKENLKCKTLWGPIKVILDPLLTNNMHFAEKFCNPTTETADPEEPTNQQLP